MEHLAGIRAVGQFPLHQVTYPQAEEDARRLAALLLAALGPDALSSCAYAAIPRGGLFVLAMLSYILDLSRPLLLVPPRPAVPLVVVDDVCLGGRRFRKFLASVQHEQVVFAHLYSHPDVRAAIQAQEPRVHACVAARDLRDHAAETYPDDEARLAWQTRWQTRMAAHAPDQPYWFGLPEPVAFPWSEPDHPYWNAETNTIEDDWRLLAPDRCLKNWARLGVPPRLDVVRALRSPDSVAFSIREDQVTLYDRRSDAVYGLEGAAAAMWRAIAAYGDGAAAAAHLLECFQVEEGDLRADLGRFVDELMANGLLETVAARGGG